jgi:hypothetical protein
MGWVWAKVGQLPRLWVTIVARSSGLESFLGISSKLMNLISAVTSPTKTDHEMAYDRSSNRDPLSWETLVLDSCAPSKVAGIQWVYPISWHLRTQARNTAMVMKPKGLTCWKWTTEAYPAPEVIWRGWLGHQFPHILILGFLKRYHDIDA